MSKVHELPLHSRMNARQALESAIRRTPVRVVVLYQVEDSDDVRIIPAGVNNQECLWFAEQLRNHAVKD